MYIFGIFIDNSIGLPLFFLSGLYVALSPCLFPIMPMTIFRIMSTEMLDAEGNEIQPSRSLALRWVSILVGGILFTFLSFALILMYLWIEIAVQMDYLADPLSLLLGIILLIMGFSIIVPEISERTFARIPIPIKVSEMMNRDQYKQWDLFLIGFGYSFIALPCAFPVFGALVGIIVNIANPIFTLTGLTLFGIGLFIPYLILVYFTAEARVRAARILAERFRVIEIVTGVVIVIFGLLFIWPFFGGPNLLVLNV